MLASTSAATAAAVLLAGAATALPSPSPPLPQPLSKRDVPAAGYFNPDDAGGSMLTTVANTYPAGLGEPLNVIISGHSDSDVLGLGDGWLNYYESIGFGGECLGQHLGDAQQANLGDGNGLLNQSAEERLAYNRDFNFGTCQETINGGNHFRWWVQNGSTANSGAIFMASSYELPLAQDHDIVPNGYDFGRDLLVGNATLSNGTTMGGWVYNTTVEYVPGLLENGSSGINHGIAIDGMVAVLNVTVTKRPAGADSAAAPVAARGAGAAAAAVLLAAMWLA